MTRKIVVLLLLLISSISSFACDICGSGVGGGYMGLLPGFHKRFISLRYSQNGLVSHLGPGGSSTYLTSRETFRVAELWGAVNIGTRFRIAGFVPVNFMDRENGTGHYRQSGIGDISLVGYYQLFSNQHTAGARLLAQSLWIGAGIKAPAGKYNPEEKSISESTQNTFQLGTGSVDFSAHLMYDLRLQDAGLNINGSWKLNTRNKFDYRYGNKITVNALAYYKLKLSDK
ncbi:MAG: transporter, partial [Chitinophagaceae bacterium]